MIDERRCMVVNPIVLKKMTTIDAVSKATALSAAEVESLAEELANAGAVARRDNHVLSTEAGPTQVPEYHAVHYGDLGTDQTIERWADRFNAINHRFLETVSAWQPVPAQGGHRSKRSHRCRLRCPCSRTDRRPDRTHISAHRRALRPCSPTDRIQGALEAAMDRVTKEETDYMSSPMVDSVRNIWFEFHEDVLMLLGKQRVE
jgi:hypothetical protein